MQSPAMEGLREIFSEVYPEDLMVRKGKQRNIEIGSFISSNTEHPQFCQSIWVTARNLPSVGGNLGADCSGRNPSVCL